MYEGFFFLKLMIKSKMKTPLQFWFSNNFFHNLWMLKNIYECLRTTAKAMHHRKKTTQLMMYKNLQCICVGVCKDFTVYVATGNDSLYWY